MNFNGCDVRPTDGLHLHHHASHLHHASLHCHPASRLHRRRAIRLPRVLMARYTAERFGVERCIVATRTAARCTVALDTAERERERRNVENRCAASSRARGKPASGRCTAVALARCNEVSKVCSAAE